MIKIRQARLDDRETIASFNEALALESEKLRLEPATIRAGVEVILMDPSRGIYFVAERDGIVVGCLLITYEWSDWRNSTFIWIQSVYVKPDHRRRGVFSSLHQHVEKIAYGPGHCGLRLYMESDNHTARKTYEKLGLSHRSYLVFESLDRLRRE